LIPFEFTDFTKTPPELEYQTSGAGSRINRFSNRIESIAGHSSSNGSTFARGKYKLPTPIGMDESFWVYGTYEMPIMFYNNITGSLRPFMSMWNHDTRWRVGLWIDSNKLPRLQLETDKGLTVLWQGNTRLPTGQHDISVHISFSKTSGLTELYIDNVLWASVVKPNVPSNFVNPVSTQILFFFDGANKQTKDISMTWYKIGASNISPIPETDPCRSLRNEYEIAKQKTLGVMRKYDDTLKILTQAQLNFQAVQEELRLADENELNAFLNLQRCELG
jgi:hypothetical protein